MVEWLTTLPHPRASAKGFDAGQKGWRLHAVEADENFKFSEIKTFRAACGLQPRHGWGLDLFIEDRCIKCVKKLGLPLTIQEQLVENDRKKNRKTQR